MPKSDQITVAARVHEVLRLILAGGEFAEIRQYASDRQWNVSDRQLRRYLEMAYKRFAKATQRDRRQLLGRHLMQRRALYARAIKNGDLKTALQVLRDEAALEGLYPSSHAERSLPRLESGGSSGDSPPSPLSRQERVVRLIAAEIAGDATQVRLVRQTTPAHAYRIPDTQHPLFLLQLMVASHVAEQLEQGAILLNALLALACGAEQPAEWDLIGQLAAYRYQVGRLGWHQFCQSLGLDGDQVVRHYSPCVILEEYDQSLPQLAPTLETLRSLYRGGDHRGELDRLTPDALARQWRQAFGSVCAEE